MSSNNDKKVLLRISNLKQWFPLKKRGLYVKANDGIDLELYEGETFGLVGESGCGKSTLGRTILQVYQQTDGRTMYYGRTIDELCPDYIRKTIKTLDKRRRQLVTLEEKRDALQAEYDALDEKGRMAKHTELDTAKKKAHDALLDITNVIGGFIVVDDLAPVSEQFLKINKLSKQLHKLHLKEKAIRVDMADYENKNGEGSAKVQGALKKLEDVKARTKAVEADLAREHAALDKMREPYKNDERFQKYEGYRDDGIDLARLKYEEMRQLRSDLQLIFQDPYSSLNPRMSIGQIIGESLVSHGFYKKHSPLLQEEVQETMEKCGLASYFLHRYPHQFSGGQRQRIGIARSLATRPKFVVCDEPVSALDVSIQSQIINLLSDLKEQQHLTYLFITHDLSVVRYISDRIGVMYLGNIVEQSESQELFDHPLHPYTEALLGAIPTTNVDDDRELVILEGDIPSPVNPPKGCKFHTRCKYCTEICKMVVPEMKEVRPNHFVACHHMLENNL